MAAVASPAALSSMSLPAPDASQSRVASQRAPHAATMPTNLYQLLGLVAERSSSGVVDKFIITQESIGRLIQTIAPGAFVSITRVRDFAFHRPRTFQYPISLYQQIDFAALDNTLLQPVGVYGSESEIVVFLRRLGVDIRRQYVVLMTPCLLTELTIETGVQGLQRVFISYRALPRMIPALTVVMLSIGQNLPHGMIMPSRQSRGTESLL